MDTNIVPTQFNLHSISTGIVEGTSGQNFLISASCASDENSVAAGDVFLKLMNHINGSNAIINLVHRDDEVITFASTEPRNTIDA
jgi:hypothetical protein